MKKEIISIILIGIMIHSVYACGRTENLSEKNDTQQEESSYVIPNWLAAYVDYMEAMEDYDPHDRCSFLYVDEDDIPEFVIDTGTYETARIVLTFHNGEIDALQIGRLRLRYIEKKNLLCDTSGQAGEYANQVYSIENGKWIRQLYRRSILRATCYCLI